MTDLQRLHEAAVLAPQLLTRIRMRLAVGEHLQPDEQLDKMQECIEVFTRAYADGPLIEVKKVQAPVEAAAPWQRKWNSQVADSLLEKFASFSPADAVVLNAMVRDLARKCDEWSSAPPGERERHPHHLPKGAWTVSKLSDLEVALGERQKARTNLDHLDPDYTPATTYWEAERIASDSDLHLSSILTDDTIRALLDVADEVTRRAPFLVADPENDRLLNLAAALTRAPLAQEATDE